MFTKYWLATSVYCVVSGQTVVNVDATANINSRYAPRPRIRGLAVDPPLAPSFERLQALVDDISENRPSNGTSGPPDPKMLPCLLRSGGCAKEEEGPRATRPEGDNSSGYQLKRTEASIVRAVTKLQKNLDMRTAEVVKEIERRAAEMRREIAIEAEQLIEAVKYLVTMLSDSVQRADEMGEGFVREWFDEAEHKYMGVDKGKSLDEDIQNLDKDMKRDNDSAHNSMIESLKESVKRTRAEYGQPTQNFEIDLDNFTDLEEGEFEEDFSTDDTSAPPAVLFRRQQNSDENRPFGSFGLFD